MKHPLLLFIFGIFFTLQWIDAEPIVLPSRSQRYKLKESIRYLIDPAGSLTPEEVYSRKNQFTPSLNRSLQIPRDGVVWILLKIWNLSSAESWILDNSMTLELIELYEQAGDTWKQTQTTGDMIPFLKRSLDLRRPAFMIRVPENQYRTYLIRLFDYHSSRIQFTLEEVGNYSRRYSRRTFILGLIFGFFAILIIYNLFIFMFNKEKTYLFYALYMTAFFLNQFTQERLMAQFIFPGQPHGYFWFILFGSATLLFGIQFFRHFIGTRKKMPRLDKGMTAGMLLSGVLALSAFFYRGAVSADILNLLSLFGMGLVFTALIMRIIRKDTLALMCFIGSVLYLLGTALEILATFLPFPVGPFVLNAQLYGAAVQVIFIAFAVGAKTFKLRQEYEKMQEKFRKDLERSVTDRTRELQKVNEKLARYAITDTLTGLYNRTELNSRIKEFNNLFTRKSNEGKSYVVAAAYLDLDNFKLCNDTLGHQYGDQLLITAASILKRNTRGYDLVFRLGGDEFLIIMPETGMQESFGIVERIRGIIEEEFSKCSDIPLSVSIGLAASDQLDTPAMETLIHQADIALLRSKEEGKNKVYSEPPEE